MLPQKCVKLVFKIVSHLTFRNFTLQALPIFGPYLILIIINISSDSNFINDLILFAFL